MTADPRPSREWSWAKNDGEVELHREHARTLIGQRIQRVRYFTLDLERPLEFEGSSGARVIESHEQWQDPPWRRQGFDTLDWGLELETDENQIYPVTWDKPGRREGVGISRAPLLGTAIASDVLVAVWDVTGRSYWDDVLGNPVRNVTMRYLPWSDQGDPMSLSSSPRTQLPDWELTD